MTDSVKTHTSREELKDYFKTGKRPTEENFSQWLDSSLLMGSDNLYCTEQRIGIGTDNPDAPLSIAFQPTLPAAEGGDYDPVGLSATFCQQSEGATDSVFHIGHRLNSADAALGAGDQGSLLLGSFVGQGRKFTPRVTLSAQGNLGIGTESPATTLDIQAPDAVIALNQASLQQNRLTLVGDNTSIAFQPYFKNDNSVAGFSIQCSPEFWQLMAPQGQHNKPPVQVSRHGKVGIGGAPSQISGQDEGDKVLKVHGDTLIKGDTRLDGDVEVTGVLKASDKVNLSNADLSAKSLQLKGDNFIRGVTVHHADYNTYLVELKNSGLKTKYLQHGEGYSTEEAHIRLAQNCWYEIAQLTFDPNVSVAGTASFKVNLKCANPNAESCVIFSVTIDNSQAQSLTQSTDIVVTLNNNYFPVQSGDSALKQASWVALQKIRVAKHDRYLSLAILTGELKFTEGTFVTLHNCSRKHWNMIPWIARGTAEASHLAPPESHTQNALHKDTVDVAANTQLAPAEAEAVQTVQQEPITFQANPEQTSSKQTNAEQVTSERRVPEQIISEGESAAQSEPPHIIPGQPIIESVELVLNPLQTSTTQGLTIYNFADQVNPGISLQNSGHGQFSQSVTVKTIPGTRSSSITPATLSLTNDGNGAATIEVEQDQSVLALNNEQSASGISLKAATDVNQVYLGELGLQQRETSLWLTNNTDSPANSAVTFTINAKPDAFDNSPSKQTGLQGQDTNQNVAKPKITTHKMSMLCGYGENATFHIAHPQPNVVQLGTNASSDMAFGTLTEGFNAYLNIKGDGKIGIGTDAPKQQFHVEGTGHISDKLGIGIAHPSNKLEVDGTAEIKGDLIIGGKLRMQGDDGADSGSGTQQGAVQQGNITLGQGDATATLTFREDHLLLILGDKAFSVNLTPISMPTAEEGSSTNPANTDNSASQTPEKPNQNNG